MPWNRVKSPPVNVFTDRSKAVLLLWIFYVFFLSCVCYVFVRVCLYVPCGHLLGKGWPLGSRLWCMTVSLSLSHWYPGSGVVLDCIYSWSLHPYLLWINSWSLFQVLNYLSLSIVNYGVSKRFASSQVSDRCQLGSFFSLFFAALAIVRHCLWFLGVILLR